MGQPFIVGLQELLTVLEYKKYYDIVYIGIIFNRTESEK